MKAIKRGVDAVYAFRFVNLLRKPFNKWPAFEKGIIDASGQTIKSSLNAEDKAHWTKFHKLVAQIKKMIDRGPTNSSELTSLWLAYKTIKEEYNLTECTGVIENEYPILKEMVSGDAGGNAENIAAGTNSGAVVYPGPKTIKKKKVKRMTEIADFKTFIAEKHAAEIRAEVEAAELKEKQEEISTIAFKAIGGNQLTFEATQAEIKTIQISGKTASEKLVEADIMEAYKELGKDGVLAYIKEASTLVWKPV